MLEILLVLAIAGSIIIMFIRQYQIYQTEKNYTVLRYNVDVLFQGLKEFYQTNCNNPASVLAPSATLSTKVLSQANITPFLTKDWPRYTPVVNVEASTSINGYFVQFSPGSSLPTQKSAYTCFNYTGTVTCANPTPIANSKIILWQAQVIVAMKDPEEALHYRGFVGADCAVAEAPSGYVDCNDASTDSANYLVWTRLPSFGSPKISSSSWMFNPVVKEFNLQYTNDPMYELSNPNAPAPPYMNYLCGG